MRIPTLVLPLLALSLVVARPAAGQGAAVAPARTDSGARSARLGPSALPAGPTLLGSRSTLTGVAGPASLTERVSVRAEGSHKGRNILLGGLIGAAAGVATCTVVSNIGKDPGTGFSSCDAKAYLGFGAVGFAAGALIGLLIN